MSYLVALAQRVLDPPGDVRPRRASPFEPTLEGENTADEVAFPVTEETSPIVVAAHTEADPPQSSLPEHASAAVEARDRSRSPTSHPAPALRDAAAAIVRAIGRAQEPSRTPEAVPPAPGGQALPRARAAGTETTMPAPIHGPRDTARDGEEHAVLRTPLVRTPLVRMPSLPEAVASTLGLPSFRRPFSSHTPEANTSNEPPVVHVSIGRIEVRAAQSAAPQAFRRAEPAHVPLSEYLRQRDAGER